MSAAGMHLKILLPFRVFAEHDAVSRIVAETAEGFFGILPRRLDGVAALVPGILVFETGEHGQQIVAVDEGVLVKAGLVTVRREGTRRLYRAVPSSVEEVRAYLAGFWSTSLDRLKAEAEAEERRRKDASPN